MDMGRQAQIRVSITGDRLVEGQVQSAISRDGVTVEKVARRAESGGGREHRFWIRLSGSRSLGEVLRAVEGIKGAAVVGATFSGTKPQLLSSSEAARG